MQLWRICKALYADSAFTGDGSFLYSGRWNPRGVRMVYTSISPTLAALELFVPIDPSQAPDDLILTSLTLPSTLHVETVREHTLSDHWNSLAAAETQSIGAEWIRSARSLALKVPSVAVRGDCNVLLNPAHPHFAQVQLHPPVPWPSPLALRSSPLPSPLNPPAS